MSSTRPRPTFEVLFTGRGISPSVVSISMLARTLEAVQSLIENRPEDDPFAQPEAAEQGNTTQTGPSKSANLHLMRIRKGSAVYSVRALDPDGTIHALRRAGRVAAKSDESPPEEGDLSAFRSISPIAKSLGCEVQFVDATSRDVLATIGPRTFLDVLASSTIRGTSTLTGSVERVGGTKNRHCAIRLSSQPSRLVICGVKDEELVRKLGALVYRNVSVTGEVEWFRANWRVRRMDIVDVRSRDPFVASEARALWDSPEADTRPSASRPRS